MNKYPVWWDTAITIYNRYEDPETNIVTWYSHIIEGAFWKYTGSKVIVGETVLETNTITCRIRKDDSFMEKYEWIQLPNDKMADYFTLGQGDIIIKGAITDTVDEYTSGSRASDLIAKYKQLQGCMEVQDVAINVGAGRCNEHYYVRGI